MENEISKTNSQLQNGHNLQWYLEFYEVQSDNDDDWLNSYYVLGTILGSLTIFNDPINITILQMRKTRHKEAK